LVNLEILWLWGNKITEIKRLDNLIKLTELHISENGPFDSNSIGILENMRENGIKVYF